MFNRAWRPSVLAIVPQDEGVAAIGPQQIEQDANGGGLAGAVQAEKSEDLSPWITSRLRLLTARTFPYRLVSPRMEMGANPHSKCSRRYNPTDEQEKILAPPVPRSYRWSRGPCSRTGCRRGLGPEHRAGGNAGAHQRPNPHPGRGQHHRHVRDDSQRALLDCERGAGGGTRRSHHQSRRTHGGAGTGRASHPHREPGEPSRLSHDS